MAQLYSAEFRQDAVDLVESSGRSVADVARELGVNYETLRGLVQQARKHQRGRRVGYGAAEAEELKQLRKRVREPSRM